MKRKELYEWFKNHPEVAKECKEESNFSYQNCSTALLMYYYEIYSEVKKEKEEETKLSLWQKIKNIFA